MKHVLIASLGLFPQIITEALWAFMNPEKLIDPAHRERSAVVPREICLVSTTSFRQPQYTSTDERDEQIRARIRELYLDLGQPEPGIDIQRLRDENTSGTESWLADIRTQRENAVYSNHIIRLVKKYSEEEETAIHMLLAGGRKTMSSYDQAAMMFFGRTQDTLSHVLVEPDDLERTWDFWWPDQKFEAKTAGGQRIETSSEVAQIDLVDVPFARLGVRLPAGVPIEAMDARLITEFVEFEAQRKPIVVDAETLTIAIGSDRVQLRLQEFCYFALYSVARVQGWRGAGPEHEGVGPNAAGWVLIDDFRYGRNRDTTLRNTPAFRFLELLHHRLIRPDDNGVIAAIRASVVGDLQDPTGFARSRLARVIREAEISPFIRELILPKTHGQAPGPRAIGISIDPSRIVLNGFTDTELRVGVP